MSGRSVRYKTCESKKNSLKSVALAVEQHKSGVPDKNSDGNESSWNENNWKSNSKISGGIKTPEETTMKWENPISNENT